MTQWQRQRADTLVPMDEACRLVGMQVHGLGKLHCPFPALHSDGGYDPTFKIFDETNSAYCFRCRTSFTPTRLYSLYHEVSLDEAARALLAHKKIHDKSMHQQFMENMAPAPIDTSFLYQALLLYCSTIPGWSALQYDSMVIAKLNKCKEILGYVRDTQTSQEWLRQAKLALRDVCARAS